ncbi:MAG: sporulation protein YhbH [Clostridiaceae bacterium]|nr:sporulation protein YhbH [Clostridiaceae bacterium]
MAIFREYDPCGRERSSEDRRRHKELVEESIKRNLGNIISEESIIGQSGNKKIKVPVKGIKEYSFVYGGNRKGAATGDGDEKRGDVIGDDSDGSIYGHGGAGNIEGEDIYETEITIEELVGYLFDDLNLPDLDRKKLSRFESVKGYRKLGYQKKGIPPRLAKRRSVVEKIKRKQSYKRSLSEIRREIGVEAVTNISDKDDTVGRFAFAEEDLRYRRLREIRKKDFNAVVICIMDVSGSMDQTKKYMARSFYFLLYQFLRHKYSNVEVVFIAHTTTAKVVSELEFFHRGESGGTYISSGYEKALEVIEQHYNPANWNIYAFHCSDGDNWIEDNERAVEYAQKLCEKCNLFGYGEIVPGYYFAGSTVKSEFISNIKADNFVIVTMSRKDDIITGLKRLLAKDGDKE